MGEIENLLWLPEKQVGLTQKEMEVLQLRRTIAGWKQRLINGR